MKTATASSLIKYFELLAGLTGIFFFYRKKESIWFAFAVFLVLLFGMESLGTWFAKNKMYLHNTNLYKWIAVPSQFIMYHFIYYKIVPEKFRRIVILSGLLFLLFALYENIFLKEQHFYAISLTISLGCISVLFFGLAYFFELLKSNHILGFKQQMAFWFCAGLLVFYLGSFPYLTFYNSMSNSENVNIARLYKVYRWIFIFLNYIMYLLFTIGFTWSRPKS